MAERTPMEEMVQRVFDANLRYWETVNRAASEYVQSMARAWSEAPFRWTPGPRRERTPATVEPPPPPKPALLLEGPAGSEARAVIVVRNDLDREAEAPVVPSAFIGPDGAPVELELRADPSNLTLPAGGQAPVTLAVDVIEDMPEGGTYRGEVSVPGLSEHGVTVVVRRRESTRSAEAASDGTTGDGAGTRDEG